MSGIVRVEKNGNYTVMNRTALNDKRLSWKAKGIIAYMLSMPDDWVFYMEELMTHSTDGKTSFQNGMKELKGCGYVERRPVREGQRIRTWETIIHEVPINSLQPDFQEVENLQVEKQEVGFQEVENQPLLSTDSLPSTDTLLSIDKNNNDDKNQGPAYAEGKQKPTAFQFYEQNGFGALASHVSYKVGNWIDDLSEELVIHAMKLAVENNVLRWNYVEKILIDWCNKKFKTIADVEADRLRFEAQKQQKRNSSNRGKPQGRVEVVPDWFSKRNEPNKSTQPSSITEPIGHATDFEVERQKILAKMDAGKKTIVEKNGGDSR